MLMVKKPLKPVGGRKMTMCNEEMYRNVMGHYALSVAAVRGEELKYLIIGNNILNNVENVYYNVLIKNIYNCYLRYVGTEKAIMSKSAVESNVILNSMSGKIAAGNAGTKETTLGNAGMKETTLRNASMKETALENAGMKKIALGNVIAGNAVIGKAAEGKATTEKNIFENIVLGNVALESVIAGNTALINTEGIISTGNAKVKNINAGKNSKSNAISEIPFTKNTLTENAVEDIAEYADIMRNVHIAEGAGIAENTINKTAYEKFIKNVMNNSMGNTVRYFIINQLNAVSNKRNINNKSAFFGSPIYKNGNNIYAEHLKLNLNRLKLLNQHKLYLHNKSNLELYKHNNVNLYDIYNLSAVPQVKFILYNNKSNLYAYEKSDIYNKPDLMRHSHNKFNLHTKYISELISQNNSGRDNNYSFRNYLELYYRNFLQKCIYQKCIERKCIVSKDNYGIADMAYGIVGKADIINNAKNTHTAHANSKTNTKTNTYLYWKTKEDFCLKADDNIIEICKTKLQNIIKNQKYGLRVTDGKIGIINPAEIKVYTMSENQYYKHEVNSFIGRINKYNLFYKREAKADILNKLLHIGLLRTTTKIRQRKPYTINYNHSEPYKIIYNKNGLWGAGYDYQKAHEENYTQNELYAVYYNQHRRQMIDYNQQKSHALKHNRQKPYAINYNQHKQGTVNYNCNQYEKYLIYNNHNKPQEIYYNLNKKLTAGYIKYARYKTDHFQDILTIRAEKNKIEKYKNEKKKMGILYRNLRETAIINKQHYINSNNYLPDMFMKHMETGRNLYYADSNTNNVTDDINSDLNNNITNNIANGLADNITNNITNGLADNVANNIANGLADNVANNIANGLADNITNNITNGLANNVTNNIADGLADNVTNNITNGLADNVTNYISNDLANNVIKHITKNISNNISNDISNDIIKKAESNYIINKQLVHIEKNKNTTAHVSAMDMPMQPFYINEDITKNKVSSQIHSIIKSVAKSNFIINNKNKNKTINIIIKNAQADMTINTQSSTDKEYNEIQHKQSMSSLKYAAANMYTHPTGGTDDMNYIHYLSSKTTNNNTGITNTANISASTAALNTAVSSNTSIADNIHIEQKTDSIKEVQLSNAIQLSKDIRLQGNIINRAESLHDIVTEKEKNEEINKIVDARVQSHVKSISKQVYETLERKLRDEKRRRGF